MNRDNPQEIPTEGEIAWMAGILEGEGTATLAAWVRNEKFEIDKKQLKAGSMKISVNLKFYNTDPGIIAKVSDILERLNLPYHLKEREMKPMMKKGGGEYTPVAPMLTLTVNKLSVAYRLAKLLQPWCFGEKRMRLAMIIQYLSRRFAKAEKAGTSRTEYDVDDLTIVRDFYAKFAKRPGNNAKLIEKLLNEHTRSAA